MVTQDDPKERPPSLIWMCIIKHGYLFLDTESQLDVILYMRLRINTRLGSLVMEFRFTFWADVYKQGQGEKQKRLTDQSLLLNSSCV